MWERLVRALEAGDATAIGSTLTDDVTLRVAVHDEAFEGRDAATMILGAVLDGALRDIRVSNAIEGTGASALMFTAQVAEYAGRADGVLILRAAEDGRISELTVFLRPLAALQTLADEMGRRIGGPTGG